MVIVEPLELIQVFRNFEDAASPWEQTGPGRDDRSESFKVESLLAKPAAETERNNVLIVKALVDIDK
ncbi:2427_t:CDS:2 [Ambispora leptoticha]|uniref:2427_t:CDS:1 n=1 Tax=Ambispora leptoticha TaxID=144679 RepID=A0A9N9B0K1_9GLOM|nr:2427_t:CDS:2 [Ambispora leptoticha]